VSIFDKRGGLLSHPPSLPPFLPLPERASRKDRQKKGESGAQIVRKGIREDTKAAEAEAEAEAEAAEAAIAPHLRTCVCPAEKQRKKRPQGRKRKRKRAREFDLRQGRESEGVTSVVLFYFLSTILLSVSLPFVSVAASMSLGETDSPLDMSSLPFLPAFFSPPCSLVSSFLISP